MKILVTESWLCHLDLWENFSLIDKILWSVSLIWLAWLKVADVSVKVFTIFAVCVAQHEYLDLGRSWFHALALTWLISWWKMRRMRFVYFYSLQKLTCLLCLCIVLISYCNILAVLFCSRSFLLITMSLDQRKTSRSGSVTLDLSLFVTVWDPHSYFHVWNIVFMSEYLFSFFFFLLGLKC